MNIQVISDLHCELNKYFEIEISPDADVLVLAGDISNSIGIKNDLTNICSKTKIPVIFVPGNHEFYYSSIENMHPVFKELSKSIKNLHILNRSSVEIDGVRFVGCTGWMDNANKQPYNFYRQRINDFNMIDNFTVAGCLRWGASDKFFIELCQADVFVTHNGPSWKSIANKYITSNLNPYFCNSWEDVLYKAKPKLWIHGHTHSCHDYVIDETRVVCNAVGYVSHGELTEFEPVKIVSV